MTTVVATSRVGISYGGFTLDATNWITVSSEYLRGDAWAEWTRTGNFYVEFNCSLLAPSGNDATDDAAFQAKIAALYAALTTPRQNLYVTWAGATEILGWVFTPGMAEVQTALEIKPELLVLEENVRDYRFAFRVRAELPGNIDATFRRQSSSMFTLGLAQRRICTISAEWSAGNATAGTASTARENYITHGDTFYDAALPTPVTDQWGTTGVWVKAAEQCGPWDDENVSGFPGGSKTLVTRIYWEVFHGRQDSQIEIDTIPVGGAIGSSRWDTRRIARARGVFTSDASHTALQNYLNNAGAYFAGVLADMAPNVSGGEWVLVDARPMVSDEDPGGGRGVLHVVHEYREPVNGLWDYTAHETVNEFNIRTVTVSGVYYKTSAGTAQANYNSGIAGLISTVTSFFGITTVDAVSVPRDGSTRTTGLEFFFQHTVHEIAYPQGSSFDDTNVLFESMDLRRLVPHDPQSSTPAIAITRLNTVKATFTAKINAQTSTDPTSLWDGGLKAHVVSTITAKLGSGVSSVMVVDEKVGPLIGDQLNQLNGELWLIVLGGSVLSLVMQQQISEKSARDFVGRGDGMQDSFYPYRKAFGGGEDFRKVLERWGWVEYVVGASGTPPALFATGDLTVSGFDFVDPGIDAQDSLDAQSATGTLTHDSDWFCRVRIQKQLAQDRGDDVSPFQTVTNFEYQRWVYCTALEAGTSLS